MMSYEEIRTMQKAVCIMLDSIVGRTEPQADSSHDFYIQKENLPLFGAVCDWVVDRLEAASRHRDSSYASSAETSRLTFSYADVLSSWWNIQDDFDNEWLEDYGWKKVE